MPRKPRMFCSCLARLARMFGSPARTLATLPSFCQKQWHSAPLDPSISTTEDSWRKKGIRNTGTGDNQGR